MNDCILNDPHEKLLEIARKHGEKCYRSEPKYAHDPVELAKDHASEVVLKYLKNYGEAYNNDFSEAKRLIYTISTNHFIDWLRIEIRKDKLSQKMGQYPEHPSTDLPSTDTEPHDTPDPHVTDTPERHALQNEGSELLTRAMENLTENQYEVIALVRIGKTEAEIAASMGLKVSQIKNARRGAYKSLRRHSALAEYMNTDMK